MVLVGLHRDLVVLMLLQGISLLFSIDPIFLGVASFVTSEVLLFKFVIDFIIFDNFSNEFPNILLIC